MNKTELFNSVTRTLHKVGFGLKKHSPEILVVGGVVGAVASGVMACKATTKLSTVLEEHKEQTDQIHDYVEEHGFTEKYTEEDSKKDLTIVTAQTGLKVVKLYAPAVILGTVSVVAILGGHNILRKRNAALAAAYAVVDKGFKEYRGRVIERFGKELDRELKYNIKAKEVEETVTNEDGTETTVTKTVNSVDPNEISEYARFFDMGDEHQNWQKDAEANLMFLRQQQNFANEKLKRKGYLFLNEVYEMIGIPVTKAGAAVGWIYDKENPIGDNYVDFGLYKNTEQNRLFINGYEPTILLDFNVDGDIWGML